MMDGLVFYDPGTGQGDFYKTDGLGAIFRTKLHIGWRSSWTQIIPGHFSLSRLTDLLFYEAASGTGEFYTTDGQGGISHLRTHTDWRPSWTQIIPGSFSQEILCVRVHF